MAHSTNNSLHSMNQNGVNGIANNMVTNVKTPRAKASFSTMENSYQNIKHKTPVNQVKEEQANQRSHKQTSVEYANEKESAAIKIQQWYRSRKLKHSRSEAARKAGEAAIRRILQQKKTEVEEHKQLDLDFLNDEENEKQKAEDRKQQRDAKAKHARQQAIRVSTGNI